MIFLENVESIIESIYLEDRLSSKSSECNVFVNPENIKYLVGKLVIINSTKYPPENIQILLDNKCKIISRLYNDNPDVEIQPYILKLNFDIMWNGIDVSDYTSLIDLYDNSEITFKTITGYKLYFPKFTAPINETVDRYDNLSALGWALQQVGVNIKTDTVFRDLDIIKLKKVDF